MSFSLPKFAATLLAASGFLAGGGVAWAASALPVQLANSAVLGATNSSLIASVPAPVVPSGKFAPAPVPDVDFSAPSLGGPAEARLMPTLLSRAASSEADGFARDSSEEHGTYEREPPAPGLNLSVPVK